MNQFINFPNLAGLAAILVSISYAYTSVRGGNNSAKNDLIQTLKNELQLKKDQNDQLKKDNAQLIDSHQKQINTLNMDLGTMKGKFEEQEKKLNDYKEILANRSPDFENTIKALLGTSNEAMQFMSDARVALKIPYRKRKKGVITNASKTMV